MFLMLSVLTLLFSYSLAGVSHYFAYRTYEGKAITAYLYTTGIFVFFLGIFREKEKNGAGQVCFLRLLEVLRSVIRQFLSFRL